MSTKSDGPKSTTSPLQTEQGVTHIADSVVSKVAGLAAREVAGVHDLGGGAARALGALRERIPGGTTNASQGVSVEVGEKQAAVDVNIVVDYGQSIHTVAEAVRRRVIQALERGTGLEVVEVNVAVDDIHIAENDGATDRRQIESPIATTPRVS